MMIGWNYGTDYGADLARREWFDRNLAAMEEARIAEGEDYYDGDVCLEPIEESEEDEAESETAK